MKKELDPTEQQITKIEKYINMIWGVLKRNWGKLIVLSLLTIIVWFCYLVKNEVEHPQPVPDYMAEPAPDSYGNPETVKQTDKFGTDTLVNYPGDPQYNDTAQ